MKTTFNGTPLMDLFDKLPEINEEADKEKCKSIRTVWYNL